MSPSVEAWLTCRYLGNSSEVVCYSPFVGLFNLFSCPTQNAFKSYIIHIMIATPCFHFRKMVWELRGLIMQSVTSWDGHVIASFDFLALSSYCDFQDPMDTAWYLPWINVQRNGHSHFGFLDMGVWIKVILSISWKDVEGACAGCEVRHGKENRDRSSTEFQHNRKCYCY